MNRATGIRCLLALSLSLLSTSRALAEETPSSDAARGGGGRILLLVDARAGALATRVAAELSTLGFSVLARAQDQSAAQLSAEARAVGALAAIWIGPTAEGNVEITVLDRVTGKIVRREVLGQSLEDPTMRELVALRASELLRASLMELEAPHPPRGDVAPSAVVARVVSSPSTSQRAGRRLVLGAQSGVLLVPGLSAAPLFELSADARVGPRLRLGLGVGGQLTASRRFVAHGRIEALARWLSVGAELLLLPSRDDGKVALGLDVRALLIALSAQGAPTDASDRGQSGFVWAPGARIGLPLRVRLSNELRWVLEPAIGYTTDAIALRADGQRLQDWGRPWVQWSTGLELELP